MLYSEIIFLHPVPVQEKVENLKYAETIIYLSLKLFLLLGRPRVCVTTLPTVVKEQIPGSAISLSIHPYFLIEVRQTSMFFS